MVYNDLCRDGGDQIEKMNEATKDFNNVTRQIFEHYELRARWSTPLGAPEVSMLKHGATEVPLEGLSLGEQEILSLATYIQSSRDSYDVFLIDEPEVHLNWHLEEKLFGFLDDYCEAFNKQMVVVTHSRIVFTQRFLSKTTFLFWEGGKVKWGPDLDSEQRRRLAGEAIEIIRLGAFSKPVFFVEDRCHEIVADEIRKALSADILISPCGNRSNLRSLYRLSQVEDGWPDSYFIEDGDNEGSSITDDHFVHLDKYCIENYLLDPSIASRVTGKAEDEVRQLRFDAIMEEKQKIFQRNKFFDFVIDGLTEEAITEERLGKLDASMMIDNFLRKVDLSLPEYIARYVQSCQAQGVLREVLPPKMVAVIEAAVPETAKADHDLTTTGD